MNNRILSNITMRSLYDNYGQTYVQNYRQLARAVVTLEGSATLLARIGHGMLITSTARCVSVNGYPTMTKRRATRMRSMP